MRAHRSVLVGVLFTVALIGSTAAPASAQTEDVRREIEQLRKELETIQREYGERLSALEARLAGSVSTAAPAAVQAPTADAPPATSKIFNPDMAVIGNFLGAIGRNTVNPSPSLELREAEASFQAAVDPYARADFFVAFSDEGAEVEEGFITFPTLPGGLLVKVGKTKAAFGKVNTLHTHMLSWADRPLVTNNLLGGEEGITDSGLSVARLISNPWIFLEATGQVYRGSSGVFAADRRRDLTYVGHLRAYHDLSDDANLDVGGSYARGHNDAGALTLTQGDVGRFTTDLWGVDATLRWRPLQRAIYRSFLGRSELIWSRRDQPGGMERAFGFYVSGDYQFGRRWFAGARYDRSGRADAETVRDSGQSLTLTYWPSEFSQVRSQYRRTRYGEGTTANELLFQFQFSIGAHGAHPF